MKLNKQEYNDIFIKGRTKDEIEASLRKAWEVLNFEVDNYWKRATYAWAFQAASFAGYFSILNSDNYTKHPQTLFFIVCIGLISAFSWIFINKGSKTWVKHWTIHIEMLEDYITGPLFKVGPQKRYSVTNINEIIGRMTIFIWLILAIDFFRENISYETGNFSFYWQILLSTVVTIYFVGSMCFGYGRRKAKSSQMIFEG